MGQSLGSEPSRLTGLEGGADASVAPHAFSALTVPMYINGALLYTYTALCLSAVSWPQNMGQARSTRELMLWDVALSRWYMKDWKEIPQLPYSWAGNSEARSTPAPRFPNGIIAHWLRWKCDSTLLFGFLPSLCHLLLLDSFTHTLPKNPLNLNPKLRFCFSENPIQIMLSLRDKFFGFFVNKNNKRDD